MIPAEEQTKEKKVKKMMATLMILLASATSHAGVEFLGQTTLGQFKDYDVINVQGQCPSPGNQAIYSLKLKIARRGAEINHLKIQYGDGHWDTLNVRQYFPAGGESRWMDLNGAYRCVEKIFIVGDTQKLIPIGQRSIVRVYGMR